VRGVGREDKREKFFTKLKAPHMCPDASATQFYLKPRYEGLTCTMWIWICIGIHALSACVNLSVAGLPICRSYIYIYIYI
jgi:hypothetical protein